MCRYVCVELYACEYEFPRKPEGGAQYPGAIVPGIRELPVVGAKKMNHKGSISSELLRHLSRPLMLIF